MGSDRNFDELKKYTRVHAGPRVFLLAICLLIIKKLTIAATNALNQREGGLGEHRETFTT